MIFYVGGGERVVSIPCPKTRNISIFHKTYLVSPSLYYVALSLEMWISNFMLMLNDTLKMYRENF